MKKRKRKCTSICHNAKGDRCECICEGVNHGKNYKRDINYEQTSKKDQC